MQRFRRKFARAGHPSGPPATGTERHLDSCHLEMATALVLGLERRNARTCFLDHCARVSSLADHVAEGLALGEDARADLRAAAQLHEIGMISVPLEMLEATRPLDDAELARVRRQAEVGAEIVRATQSDRVARLIEHQYADFTDLREKMGSGRFDLLLASILRAADVFDAVTHPRPYQQQLDASQRRLILMRGAGTRYDPRVVEVLLEAV